MIEKVFDFADKDAADVMVPRPEVVAISVLMKPEEALAAVIDSPYTRYPVYRETLDNVVGILHVRDLFSAMYEKGLEEVHLEGLLRPAEAVVDFQHGIEFASCPSLVVSATKTRMSWISEQIEISAASSRTAERAAGEKRDKIEEIPARG